MPAEGQLNLLELVDEISKIRSLIECAWMAGASLPKDNAIQTVLGDAERRLADVQGKINSPTGRLRRVTTMTDRNKRAITPSDQQRDEFDRKYRDWHATGAAAYDPEPARRRQVGDRAV